MVMNLEWAMDIEARQKRVPTNIDEFFDSVMAGVEFIFPFPIPVNRESKLPDVPREDAIYLSTGDAEPVIVVYDPGDGHEVAVRESFVNACYDGEFGGTKKSMNKLVNIICNAMEPYITMV